MTTGKQVIIRDTGEIIEAQPIKLTTQAIAIIQENIKLAEMLVTSTLEKGVDWGPIPGMKGEVLFDPGTSKIMAAFNCYSSHRVLYHEETDDAISWAVDIELISRDSRQVVATGVGHASTREKKWGKRWSKDPLAAGYTEAEAEQLEKKQFGQNEPMSYHIANPDLGDLGHTLFAMACKRGECDAVKSLPGVNSALRKLFDPQLKKTMDAGGTASPLTQADIEPPDITLNQFWGMMKGVSKETVHKILGVASVNDWTGSGKLLRDAAGDVLQKLAVMAAGKAAPQSRKEKTVDQIVAADVKTVDDLVALCKKYWNLEEAGVFQSLVYPDREAFIAAGLTTPWQAFEMIRSERSQ